MKRRGDRTVLVIGATSGIGEAVVETFISYGDTVIGSHRSDKSNSSLHDRIQLDLDCLSSVEAARRYIGGRDIDALVICAGIFNPSWTHGFSDDGWEEMLSVNLKAPAQIMQEVARLMVSRGTQGRIVQVASIAAHRPRAGCLTYGTSKGGAQGLVRAIALDMAPHNILVNTVSPGLTDTPMVSRNLTIEERSRREQGIPKGRLAAPSDIAGVIEFLCSDKNSYITGQDLTVDGGESLV